MPGRDPVTIVDIGYRSTHFWVVSAGRSRLLFDLGWPGSMGLMRSNLERMGIPLGEIRYGLASHYHIDHAGLAEELKRLGVPLLVLETQRAAIPGMKQFTKPPGAERCWAVSGWPARSCPRPGTPTTASRSCWMTARPSPAI